MKSLQMGHDSTRINMEAWEAHATETRVNQQRERNEFRLQQKTKGGNGQEGTQELCCGDARQPEGYYGRNSAGNASRVSMAGEVLQEKYAHPIPLALRSREGVGGGRDRPAHKIAQDMYARCQS